MKLKFKQIVIEDFEVKLTLDELDELVNLPMLTSSIFQSKILEAVGNMKAENTEQETEEKQGQIGFDEKND